jgi:hypothetical protein
MNIVALFLMYAVIFRPPDHLICGALSIVLGYRLFCRGIFAAKTGKPLSMQKS